MTTSARISQFRPEQRRVRPPARELMALRFSGRFRVMVATPESYASWMVVNSMYKSAFNTSVLRRERFALRSAPRPQDDNAVSRRLRIPYIGRQFPPKFSATRPATSAPAIPRLVLQRLDHRFGGDISHQRILRERASAQSAQYRIKTAAARIVRGLNFLRCLIGTAVQMQSDFQIVELGIHR